ncbi:hypothetical protein [Kitasatospora sp. MBT63]|uniref:hypothetical protein n=1 Tax=Kitasatospora sp. MBT63 TaxID=1444768 RepID=UPI00053A1337|nr:hypothetical protein [Kitasatospora sp. MBT63]
MAFQHPAQKRQDGRRGRFERFAELASNFTSSPLFALHSERRTEHAIRRKLDAIARAMLEQQDGKRGQAHEDLKAAVGMEERL